MKPYGARWTNLEGTDFSGTVSRQWGATSPQGLKTLVLPMLKVGSMRITSESSRESLRKLPARVAVRRILPKITGSDN